MATVAPKLYKTGQFLFHEGDKPKCIYLIKKGTVAIRKVKGSAQVELARVYANEVLGELSFFDRLPRSASAVASTEVEAVEITFDSLDKIYANIPPYMKAIIASLTDRLRKANETIKRLQKNIVPGEVVKEEKKEAEQSEATTSEATETTDADAVLAAAEAAVNAPIPAPTAPEEPKKK